MAQNLYRRSDTNQDESTSWMWPYDQIPDQCWTQLCRTLVSLLFFVECCWWVLEGVPVVKKDELVKVYEAEHALLSFFSHNISEPKCSVGFGWIWLLKLPAVLVSLVSILAWIRVHESRRGIILLMMDDAIFSQPNAYLSPNFGISIFYLHFHFQIRHVKNS